MYLDGTSHSILQTIFWSMYRLVIRAKKLTGIISRLPASKEDFSSRLWISKYSCCPWLFQTTASSYAMRRTQYDRLSQQQLNCHIVTTLLLLARSSALPFYQTPCRCIPGISANCHNVILGLATVTTTSTTTSTVTNVFGQCQTQRRIQQCCAACILV